MSIEDHIAGLCTDTAVYWAPLGDDGMGGMLFAEPVEIDCRWEHRVQVLTDAKGTVIGSRGSAVVTQDVEEEGFLFHGTLDDLEGSEADSSGIYYDPKQVEGAYEIKQFEKVPALRSTTAFYRKAYLLIWQRR